MGSHAEDVEMLDAEAVLEEIKHYRNDPGYQQTMFSAEDMEIDDAGGATDVLQQPSLGGKLLMVVDTNILLAKGGLSTLDAIGCLFGPQAQGAYAASGLQVVTIVPWIVLVELDGLKSHKSGEQTCVIWIAAAACCCCQPLTMHALVSM
jgi:hypothetical protein